MNVELPSPREKYMFEGRFDPMVAEENDCKYKLRCDECGHETIGTNWDLHELGWEYSFSFNSDTMNITSSEAKCPKCNGNSEEELEVYEKAQKDKNQISLSEVAQKQ